MKDSFRWLTVAQAAWDFAKPHLRRMVGEMAADVADRLRK